jgi:hypothetical protein
MLYIIYAESAQYCGYGQHFVVSAETKELAEALAEYTMQEYFYELYQEELEEDNIEDECLYSVQMIEEFHESHELWKYYQDPSQREFFTRV